MAILDVLDAINVFGYFAGFWLFILVLPGLVWASSHRQGYEEHEGKTIGSRKDAKNAKFRIPSFLCGLCAFARDIPSIGCGMAALGS